MIFIDPPYGLNGKNYFNNYHYDYDYDDQVPFDLKSLEFNSDFVIWGANYYETLPLSRVEIGWVVWDKRPTRENWDQETRESADRIFGQHFEIAVTNIKGKSGKIIRKTWGGFYGTAGNERDDTIVHKTQKPVCLLDYFLLDKHKNILDYFSGSGSTLIACEKNNRNFFGLEIMPEYCQVIIDRWEKYTNKEAYIINNSQRIPFSELIKD
jgi:DNA modification methylase